MIILFHLFHIDNIILIIKINCLLSSQLSQWTCEKTFATQATFEQEKTEGLFIILFCLFLIHLHCKYGFCSVCLQLGDFYLAILVKVWPPGSSVFPIPVQQSRCKCFLTCTDTCKDVQWFCVPKLVMKLGKHRETCNSFVCYYFP